MPGRHISWLPLNGDVGCGDPTLPGTMHPADSVLDHAEPWWNGDKKLEVSDRRPVVARGLVLAQDGSCPARGWAQLWQQQGVHSTSLLVTLPIEMKRVARLTACPTEGSGVLCPAARVSMSFSAPAACLKAAHRVSLFQGAGREASPFTGSRVFTQGRVCSSWLCLTPAQPVCVGQQP